METSRFGSVIVGQLLANCDAVHVHLKSFLKQKLHVVDSPGSQMLHEQ